MVFREVGVEVPRLEDGREKALLGRDGGLNDRHQDTGRRGLDSAMCPVGELTMEDERLRMKDERTGRLAKFNSMR